MNDAAFAHFNNVLRFALIILTLLWVSFRLFSLGKLRTRVLSQKLGLATPPKPIVTVEQLTETQARVRWSNDDLKCQIRYVLELNCNTFEAQKGCDYVLFEELAPNTTYTVIVSAVGSNDRTAKSAVRFRTLKHGEDRPPIEAVQESGSSNGKSSSGDIQSQVAEIIEQQRQATEAFDKEKAILKRSLDNLNQDRRKADQSRAQQRAESKSLEETKRALDLAMSKAKSRHADIQALLNNQHSTQNRWTTEIEQWQRADDLLEESKLEVCRKHSEDVASLEATKERLTEDIAAMEKWIKNQAAVNKAARLSQSEILSRLEQLRKNTDLATGEVPKEILKQVAAGIADSAVIDFLVADCAQDAQQEREWVETQKLRESQYVEAYLRYEDASRKLQEATARAQAHAKAQAHRATASIASSGSSRSLSSMVSHPQGASTLSSVFSPASVSLQSGVSLSPATSVQTADYQFDTPALHSWLTPRGSLESSRSSSMFFGPAVPQDTFAPSRPLSLEEDKSEENTDTNTDSSADTKSPRKKKSFFTLEASNRRSFVRRLSFFPKKDEKRFEHIEEGDEQAVSD